MVFRAGGFKAVKAPGLSGRLPRCQVFPKAPGVTTNPGGRSMKKFTFVLVFAFGIIAASYGQTKRADIIKLLDVSNTKSQAEQMFSMMLPSLQAMAPGAPQAFWTAFEAKLDLAGFIEMFIPLYDKYFTHDEIKGLIQFYESPVGRKMLAVNPDLMQESFGIGQAWGQKLAEDIIKELSTQGY
jgi:hypothetical protein